MAVHIETPSVGCETRDFSFRRGSIMSSASADHRKHWESYDFSITKIVLTEGRIREPKPRLGANVLVRISELSVTGMERELLQNSPQLTKYLNRASDSVCDFNIGDAESDIDRTFEDCVAAMAPKEKSEFAMRVNLDLQRNKKHSGSGPTDHWLEIECTLELENLVNSEPIYAWYPETKLEKAKEWNETAVRLFKQQRYLDAFHKFRLVYTMLKYILVDKNVDKEVLAEAEQMETMCQSNFVACHFQWGNFGTVISMATAALNVRGDNVKLLYRRGVAHLEMKDYEEAQKDLSNAHRLDPKNKAIHDKLGELKVKVKRRDDAYATAMKKMFKL